MKSLGVVGRFGRRSHRVSKWDSAWRRLRCTVVLRSLLVRGAEHFVRIPDGVSDRDAAAVVLNYVTAWQMIYRVAKVRGGQTAWSPALPGVWALPRCNSYDGWGEDLRRGVGLEA